MVDLALKMLLHDKLRFLMTVVGVAFADTLVLVQVAIFLGMLDNASITIDHLDADLWIASRNTQNVDFPHPFSETYVQRVRSIDGIERADNLIVDYMDVALPTGARETLLVYALEDFTRWGLPWNVPEGDLGELRRGRYLFLDDSAERRVGPFRVGEYREVAEHRLKVIGRSKGVQSFTTSPVAFLDYRLVQDIDKRLADKTTYVLVKLVPGADPEAVRAEIRRRLTGNDVFTRAEWRDASRTYWLVNTGMGLSMYLTVFLGCLVGVVIVAQTLYASTMEHLREFGTVKAIGGSNLDIYSILARQASIAAVVGFALGVVSPFLMRPAVVEIGLNMVIPNELLAGTFVGTVVLCLSAAMVSFRKVASIDPALVFRG